MWWFTLNNINNYSKYEEAILVETTRAGVLTNTILWNTLCNTRILNVKAQIGREKGGVKMRGVTVDSRTAVPKQM